MVIIAEGTAPIDRLLETNEESAVAVRHSHPTPIPNSSEIANVIAAADDSALTQAAENLPSAAKQLEQRMSCAAGAPWTRRRQRSTLRASWWRPASNAGTCVSGSRYLTPSTKTGFARSTARIWRRYTAVHAHLNMRE